MKQIICLLLICLSVFAFTACKDEPTPTPEPAPAPEKVYLVGSKGPTGGYIFYDCDADNDSCNADGLKSSECGWRYLEAAPYDLVLIDGVPTIDANATGYSEGTSEFLFGYYRTTDDGPNLYVNGTAVYNAEDCTRTEAGTGENNTKLLVEKMGAAAYSASTGSDKTGNYAARLCDILTYTVDGVTYDDWFLPSLDELKLMYVLLKARGTGIGGFADAKYKASSEYSTVNNSWHFNFENGALANTYTRYFFDGLRIRPVRAF